MRFIHNWLFVVGFLATILCTFPSFGQESGITLTNFKVEHSPTDSNANLVTIVALTDNGDEDPVNGSTYFKVNGDSALISFNDGKGEIDANADGGLHMFHALGDAQVYKLCYLKSNEAGISGVSSFPLWVTILPPLLAIALALIFKEVISALFAGIWLGSFIICGFQPGRLIESIMRVLDTYIIGSLNDAGHLSVILFSMMIAGMVGIISKNGGMMGVVNFLSRFAKTARSTQLVTWFLGLLIFFDDYANSLIVGNTMRPVADRFKVSREKLAYIVDSTAAPIAAVGFVTTWIGAEVDYIEKSVASLSGIEQSGYSIFLSSLQYAHYPFMTIIFMFILIMMKKDFGPMIKAERKARARTDDSDLGELYDDEELRALEPAKETVPKAYNALIPILAVIFITFGGLLLTGFMSVKGAIPGFSDLGYIFSDLPTIVGAADSYIALIWGSLSGLLLAVVLSIGGRVLSLEATITTMLTGFKSLLTTMIILVSAWALAIVTEELYTAGFLSTLLVGNISPWILPAFVFALAGFIAFSTGSSWSTMAILYPLIIPTTWAISEVSGLDHESSMQVLYNVVAAVMGGSVLGDHCSPISDTTILSSLATSCNHLDHVKTQLPYALTVGTVTILTTGVLFALGLPSWLGLIIGIGILFAIVRFFGKDSEVQSA